VLLWYEAMRQPPSRLTGTQVARTRRSLATSVLPGGDDLVLAGHDGRVAGSLDLRRVQAPQSAQPRRRRIWWRESQDLGQHLLGRDLELPAVGPGRFLKHFLCRGRHAEAILFRDVLERRLLRHGADR